HEDQDHSALHVAPRELRVSDADREHVVGLLEQAIGQGVLGLDEFTTRTDTALAARTRAELNIVLADLPRLRHRDAPAPPGPGPGQRDPTLSPGEESAAEQDHLRLTAHGSTLRRSGRWAVPSSLVVRNKYGETRLDFTEARVACAVVSVDLHCEWGSATLIIPEHAAIDTNNITEVKWGAIHDRTHSDHATATPRYVLSGRVRGGTLTIRHPRRGIFAT